MKAVSVKICESINLVKFRMEFTGTNPEFNNYELLYYELNKKYFYLFKYGVVCFWGYDDTEITKLIKLTKSYCNNPISERISEEYQLTITPDKAEVAFNSARIKENDHLLMKLVMFHLSQSVALIYYKSKTEQLLVKIQKYTSQLEECGNFKISWKALKRFIGKALSINNRISENLFVFETHPIAWDNEYYDTVDQELKRIFDIQSRTRNIQEDIQIIKNNLDIFTNLIFHKKSTFLEWIVILLILIEVLDMIIEQILLHK